jgi:hypothetical protein
MIKEILGIAGLLLAIGASAADFSVKTGAQPPPEKLAEPIRKVFSSGPIELAEGGKTILRIWFRTDLPLKAKPSSPGTGLNNIAETTLAAVISVEETGLKDYKDNDISKGVFTARFVMQPQDGDHLGTAEFNTFFALISAENDKTLDAFTKYTPTVKASGKLTSSGHPQIISLRPVSAADGTFPSVTEPAAEHKAIRVKVPAKTSGGEAADLVFDLVFQGHGHIQ